MFGLKIDNVNGELITVEQACFLTNLGKTTIRDIAQKAGAARKIGRSYRIHREKLLSYIEDTFCENC